MEVPLWAHILIEVNLWIYGMVIIILIIIY